MVGGRHQDPLSARLAESAPVLQHPDAALQYLLQLMLYPETCAIASADAQRGVSGRCCRSMHYDVVIVRSNSAFNDGVTLGDRLADYVDAVAAYLGRLSFFGSGLPMALGGRFVSGGQQAIRWRRRWRDRGPLPRDP